MYAPKHRKRSTVHRIIRIAHILNTIAAIVVIAFISQTIYAAMFRVAS